MIAASLVGIFLIPVLYVVFQHLREKIKRRAQAPATAQPAVADRVGHGH
jgi:hypothetical protein